jgi:hypothetical protein
MTFNYQAHSKKVDAWIKASTQGLSADELVDLFELATSRLWQRSSITISDVTLCAVADRALYTSSGMYPILLPLKINPSGIQWGDFRKSSAKLNPNELVRAFGHFITEFITILSSITAEMLSAPLHQELSKVRKK